MKYWRVQCSIPRFANDAKLGAPGRVLGGTGEDARRYIGDVNYGFAKIGQPLRLCSGQAQGGCPCVGVFTTTNP
jgi:hypothetical protein